MRPLILSWLVLLPLSASAQQPSPKVESWLMPYAIVGYPIATGVGIDAVVGRIRPAAVPGRGRWNTGMLIGAEVGAGGTSFRAGFARLFAYDAGADGWAFDARYFHPWLLNWGPDGERHYVGVGATSYVAWFKLSGGVARSVSGNAKFVVMADLALVFDQ